ncbi:MAG: YdcF family protein [Caldilinea sp. CFX5]|nr:YdcF family protein [Caldilinea sp. CFX5]
MEPGLIVILGSPNTDDGHLPAMALGRVTAGYQLYQERRAFGWQFLVTGGFGEHFNRTAFPHAYYLHQWLLAQGVPAHAIVDFALSRHTGEDALLARPIIERSGVRRLCVVTSDFHVERAAFIFRTVFADYALEFVGVPYLPLCAREEQERLLAHERRRLAELQKLGR